MCHLSFISPPPLLLSFIPPAAPNHTNKCKWLWKVSTEGAGPPFERGAEWALKESLINLSTAPIGPLGIFFTPLSEWEGRRGGGRRRGRLEGQNKEKEKERKERGDQASTFSIQGPASFSPSMFNSTHPTPPPHPPITPCWNQSLWFYFVCSSSTFSHLKKKKIFPSLRSGWCQCSGGAVRVCRRCSCSWCCQVQGWLLQNNGSRRLQMNARGKSVMELKGIRLWGALRGASFIRAQRDLNCPLHNHLKGWAQGVPKQSGNHSAFQCF